MTSDQTSVMHCPVCGTNVLEDNAINRITLSDAKRLSIHADGPKNDTISQLCPVDHTPLKLLREESIPQFVTILKCSECSRIVVSGEDLVAFKKAQKSKVNFFKNWQIPLPSLHTVLVYSFLVGLGLTTLSMFGSIFTPTNTRTQARDVIKNITITKNDTGYIVYFTTIAPFSSRITFYNKTTNKVLLEQDISKGQNTVHLLQIRNLEPSTNIYFKITLSNDVHTVISDPTPYTITQ
jgi:hypothetical protein